MYKVIIADDHRLLKEGLASMINSTLKYQVIDEASNGIVLLEKLSVHLPDILILDISMPGMDGFEVSRVINDKYPKIKILLLTMFTEGLNASKFISSNIKGLVLKEASMEELITAMDEIMENRTYFSQKFTTWLFSKINSKTVSQESQGSFLTSKELEILSLLCQGYNSSEIALALSVSQRTVEAHKQHLFNKTKCNNVVNLVLFALKNKLIDTDKSLQI